MLENTRNPHDDPASNREKWRASEGFTLVELLVVLVIVGLLAGMVAPKVLGYLGGARRDTAIAQIRNIENALELYYIDNGSYPSDAEGLGALAHKPQNLETWGGPYLKYADDLKDPWGNAYQYALAKTNGTPTVVSYGSDGSAGGEGEASDLP